VIERRRGKTYQEKGGDTSTHSGVEIRLGALDVVLNVVAEGLHHTDNAVFSVLFQMVLHDGERQEADTSRRLGDLEGFSLNFQRRVETESTRRSSTQSLILSGFDEFLRGRGNERKEHEHQRE
jgi:hypothetical protein